MRANDKVRINFLADVEDGANRLFRDDLASPIPFSLIETTTISRKKNKVKSSCQVLRTWREVQNDHSRLITHGAIGYEHKMSA